MIPGVVMGVSWLPPPAAVARVVPEGRLVPRGLAYGRTAQTRTHAP